MSASAAPDPDPLYARAELNRSSRTVREVTSERARAADRSVEHGVQQACEEISLASTQAVGRSMEGKGLSRRTWRTVAELAAWRDALLKDTTLVGGSGATR